VIACCLSSADHLLAKVDRHRPAPGPQVEARVHVPRVTISAPLATLVLAHIWRGCNCPSMRTTGSVVDDGHLGRAFVLVVLRSFDTGSVAALWCCTLAGGPPASARNLPT
jgi:hypothetical protein